MAIPEEVEAAIEELCRRVYALAKADLSEPWTMRSDRVAVAESFRDGARAALVHAIEQAIADGPQREPHDPTEAFDGGRLG